MPKIKTNVSNMTFDEFIKKGTGFPVPMAEFVKEARDITDHPINKISLKLLKAYEEFEGLLQKEGLNVSCYVKLLL